MPFSAGGLSAAQIQAKYAAPAAAPPAREMSGGEQLLMQIEGMDLSPMGQEVARAMMSEAFGFTIPSREDIEYKRARTEQAREATLKMRGERRTRDIIGVLIDNSASTIQELAGEYIDATGAMSPEDRDIHLHNMSNSPSARAFADIKLNDLMATKSTTGIKRIDGDLIDNPDQLREATRILSSAIFGNESVGELRSVDLFEFAPTRSNVHRTELDRESEVLARSKTNLMNRESLHEALQDIVGGGGELGAIIDADIEALEGSGQKISTSQNWFSPGALGGLAGAQQIAGPVSRIFQSRLEDGPEAGMAFTAFLQDRGIGEIIRDNITVSDEGEIIAMDKNKKDVVMTYLMAIQEASNLSAGSVSVDDVMSALGIQASGFSDAVAGEIQAYRQDKGI
jgi:hypothetical protein